MSETQLIAFQGHDLISWRDEQTGKVVASLKAMCDPLGLSITTQVQRLRGNPLFAEGLVRGKQIPTPGGKQSMYGLDIEMIQSWLASINSTRVRPEKQAMLLAFQRECAQALQAYWTTGAAVNPRLTTDPRIEKYPELRAIMDLIVATAEAREVAEAAQAEAAQAKGLAQLALQGQEWLTIRQYVLVHHLEHQLPDIDQTAYGVWLREHCSQHNIPVYRLSPADRTWDHENTYHSGTIKQTLWPWLTRRHGQGNLLTLPTRQS